MLGSHWPAKLEFDHPAFGSKTLTFVNPSGNSATLEGAVNQVKAGLNYHCEGLLQRLLFGVDRDEKGRDET